MEYTNRGTKNDRWIVEHIFPGEYGKYFIEAGACTGIKGSSCYVLEKHLQWTGICIEPNNNYFQELVKNRPHSICENICLSNSNGIVTYMQGDEDRVHPMRGGIKSNLLKYRNNYQEIISQGQEVEKKSMTLYELLKKHNAPKVIHYLAMDIEGSELPVLEVFPFEEYKILAISVEGKKCNDLLVSKGYINVNNPFNTDKLFEQYFVHESIATAKILKKNAIDYIKLGDNLRSEGKSPEAITAYQQALNLEPDNSKVYALLGIVQKEQGDLLAAISNFQKAIEINPYSPAWVYRSLGGALQKQGKNEEAITAYYQAIETDSETPGWVYQSLGNALSKQQRWDEAITAYQQAKELKPNNAAIGRKLEQLQQKNTKGNVTEL